VLLSACIKPGQITAVGITNQRETTVVWEKDTGAPIYNAIVWQCRRTAAICEGLEADGLTKYIADTTGLIPDAYFSATKLKWILDTVPGARERAQRGELLFGTVDTWLIWNLTGGKAHVTDFSNASRTMLFNIDTLKWDELLCKKLDIPENMLPLCLPSSHIYGTVAKIPGLELLEGVPIAGDTGDQQAALFGQTCFEEGQAKNTYGTGCFTLMNTGEKRIRTDKGLLSVIAWGIGSKVIYALEGSVFNAGSVIQWLRDEMGIIKTAHEADILAGSVTDTQGVVFVPAFTGLGAPYWDMYARGTILGLTRGAGKAHIARAVLESIAYQVSDLFYTMREVSGIALKELRVDGGASVSDFLMQFQADMLGTPVDRPTNIETTAAGAGFLAGLACGFWPDMEALKACRESERIFLPQMEPSSREALYADWKRGVERSREWAK
jgi:glycerol kinase